MAAPAPETKPASRTSTTASMFDVYEVLLTQGSSPAVSITPRPRMAYSQADAVLALTETLKANGVAPKDFLDALGDAQLEVAQIRLLECDGKHFEILRLKANSTHEVITARIADYYPGAMLNVPSATPLPEAALPVEVDVPTVFTNSGSSRGGSSSADEPKPKVRKVTTIYGGGGGGNSEAITKTAAKLTPEMVAKGVVIVMGKNGPKVLSAAHARTEEEENEAMADAEASGEDYIPEDGGATREVQVVREAEPAAPAPKPAPAIRILSGDQAEKVMRVSSIETREVPEVDEAALMEMDGDIAAALGSSAGDTVTHAGSPRRALHQRPVEEGSEETASEFTHEEEVGGGRRVKRQDVTKRDRGGSRPVRQKG